MKVSFSRPLVKNLRKEIDKALAPLGKKYKVDFQLGAIHFDTNEMRVKLTGIADKKAAQKEKKKKLAEDFKFWGEYSGFKKSDLGRVFTFRGTEYKVAGWNYRAKSKNIKLERTRDGKTFKCSPADLKIFLKG